MGLDLFSQDKKPYKSGLEGGWWGPAESVQADGDRVNH